MHGGSDLLFTAFFKTGSRRESAHQDKTAGIPTAPWSWCRSFIVEPSHIYTLICRYGAIGIFMGACSRYFFPHSQIFSNLATMQWQETAPGVVGPVYQKLCLKKGHIHNALWYHFQNVEDEADLPAVILLVLRNLWRSRDNPSFTRRPGWFARQGRNDWSTEHLLNQRRQGWILTLTSPNQIDYFFLVAL